MYFTKSSDELRRALLFSDRIQFYFVQMYRFLCRFLYQLTYPTARECEANFDDAAEADVEESVLVSKEEEASYMLPSMR